MVKTLGRPSWRVSVSQDKEEKEAGDMGLPAELVYGIHDRFPTHPEHSQDGWSPSGLPSTALVAMNKAEGMGLVSCQGSLYWALWAPAIVGLLGSGSRVVKLSTLGPRLWEASPRQV